MRDKGREVEDESKERGKVYRRERREDWRWRQEGEMEEGWRRKEDEKKNEVETTRLKREV